MSLFGKIFGDAKDGQKGGYTDALSAMSQETFNRARPVNVELADRYTKFLQGGGNILDNPQFQTQYTGLKDAAEQQYALARDNMMGSTPMGGSLTSNLARLQGQKASQLTQGMSGIANDIYNQEMSRAYAYGTGQTPVALGGMGAAANGQNYMQAAQSAQQGQAMQGLGRAAGQYLGSSGNKNDSGSNRSALSSAASMYGWD